MGRELHNRPLLSAPPPATCRRCLGCMTSRGHYEGHKPKMKMLPSLTSWVQNP